MSDFDKNMVQNDLFNPFSPYNVNRPTVMDIVNNPEKYLNSSQVPNISQPVNPNNETLPKTNFFNKNAPDIRKNQPYDCFTSMHNNIAKMKKHNAAKNLFGAIAVGLGIGLFSGKMLKFPKINLSKFKLSKIKLPKIKSSKIKMPKLKFTMPNMKNVTANIKNSTVSKKLGQYFTKVKNIVAKKNV